MAKALKFECLDKSEHDAEGEEALKFECLDKSEHDAEGEAAVMFECLGKSEHDAGDQEDGRKRRRSLQRRRSPPCVYLRRSLWSLPRR